MKQIWEKFQELFWAYFFGHPYHLNVTKIYLDAALFYLDFLLKERNRLRWKWSSEVKICFLSCLPIYLACKIVNLFWPTVNVRFCAFCFHQLHEPVIWSTYKSNEYFLLGMMWEWWWIEFMESLLQCNYGILLQCNYNQILILCSILHLLCSKLLCFNQILQRILLLILKFTASIKKKLTFSVWTILSTLYHSHFSYNR